MQDKKNIIMYHFIDTGNYYLMHKDFEEALMSGCQLKVKQEFNNLEIYGFKRLPGIMYKVEDCYFPETIDLKIINVEEPIKIYSVMEDTMKLISQIDFEKVIEKGSKISINNANKYKIPVVGTDEYYEILDAYYLDNLDVRSKYVSKWYIEKLKVK